MESTSQHSHLSDRVVVVTGAGSGFGRLIARGAAARGARVVVSDIDPDSATATVDTVTGEGGSAVMVEADVTDAGQMHALAAQAVDEFGAIDVLVNNAGIMPLAFLSDHAVATDAWDRCIDINLKGVLHGISAVYDQMTAQGRGHIVNIASIYGNVGTAGSAVYSATKAAVVILSDALRKETQGRIKVTVVRPTGVNPAAASGALGTRFDEFMAATMQTVTGRLEGPLADVDSPRFWAIRPETIAAEVIHAIDQPWGVTISDVSIRATGEMFTM